MSSRVWTLEDGQAAGWQSPLWVTATHHLSSAEILTLHSSPVEVLAAPGAGKMILPSLESILFYNAGTPYAGASHHLMFTTPSLAALNLSLIEVKQAGDFMLTSAADIVVSFENGASADVSFPQVDPADVENEPLVVYITGANPTTGTGTIDFDFLYRIVDIP